MKSEKTNKGDLIIATVLYIIVIIIFVLLVINISEQKRIVVENMDNNDVRNTDKTVEEYYPIVSYNNYGERIPADYYQVLPVGPNPVTLTINPIHIYISIANAEYTYDGLKHSPDIHEVIKEEDEYNNVSYRDPLQDETNLVFGDKLNLAPYTTANVKDVQNADYVYSYSMIDFDLFMKGY